MRSQNCRLMLCTLWSCGHAVWFSTAARCDRRDPGWGDPSAAWIVASAPSDGHLARLFVLSLLVRWPARMIAHKLLSEFIKSTLLSNCPGFWLCFFLFGFWWVVFLFWFVFFGVVCCTWTVGWTM